MKRPIKWHEECLKNQERYLAQQKAEAKRQIDMLVRDVAKLEADAIRRRLQISRAKKLGKDGFDEERFQPEKGGE